MLTDEDGGNQNGTDGTWNGKVVFRIHIHGGGREDIYDDREEGHNDDDILCDDVCMICGEGNMDVVYIEDMGEVWEVHNNLVPFYVCLCHLVTSYHHAQSNDVFLTLDFP